MNKINLLLLVILSGLFAACGSEKKSPDANAENLANGGILTLAPLEGSPLYETANLSLISSELTDDARVMFNFEVQNYELGVQTPPLPGNALANSGHGQHVHLIVDNNPYSAHYETSFSTDTLKEGNHVILAFLSRSYHESIKNRGTGAVSYYLDQFQVGAPSDAKPDLSAAHMFYSRPKGAYKGEEIKNVLLDFFLVNVSLSPDGFKVRATINDQEFMLTEWAPYLIQGLKPGEATIRLELLDADGNLVPSPYNPVERTITLEADAAQ
ncbi:MAG: hypothetical protein SF052_25630 [Bacteroidia bacterium]|nr:hypothetical protein [Bacteroidia bacterium]